MLTDVLVTPARGALVLGHVHPSDDAVRPMVARVRLGRGKRHCLVPNVRLAIDDDNSAVVWPAP